MKKLLSLLLFCCLLPTVGRGGLASTLDARGTILIISSYNLDTRRMSSFISEFEADIVASGIPCDIYIENLECRGVADAPLWLEQMESVINRYEDNELRTIILLGQEAWATYVSLDRKYPGVQIFGCFASSNGVLLPPPTLAEGDCWMPPCVDMMAIADSLSSGVAGGLFNHYDINRNLDLILSLYSEVETIAFVSDNTYGGISLQSLVRNVVATEYPRLQLKLIDSRAGSVAFNEAYTSLPSRSAVLMGTWRVGREGEYLMQRSINDLVKSNPSIPVFSITGTGIGDVAIGGYIPKYDNGAKNIAEQIIESHKKGSLSNTYFRLTDGEYRFDARKLLEFKIPEYALPKGSIVDDTIEATLSKYVQYVSLLSITVVLLGLLLVFIVVLLVRTKRLTHTLESRECELVVAREKAEESDRLKSAFLANMSHEIRTPLNAIVGFSSLMGDNDMDPVERAEYSAIVINNSDMLLTLLNDILDISSLECGKSKFNYVNNDIVQICQHVMLTTAHTRQEGVVGIYEPTCESCMVVTDTHRLSQILINLLTNAGKFTSHGSITLSFEVHNEERLIYFSVTDTGEGIPVDKHDTVFNRFEKLEGNKKKGTGLGLAICRHTVAIFGGRIWVDSKYSQGARFVFTHPMDLTLTNPEDGENSEGGGDLTTSNSITNQI